MSNIKNGSRDIDNYIGIIGGKYTVTVKILEEVEDILQLRKVEQKYIDEHYPNDRCLNACKTASLNRKVKELLDLQESNS